MAKKVNLSKARCRPPSFRLYEREFSFLVNGPNFPFVTGRDDLNPISVSQVPNRIVLFLVWVGFPTPITSVSSKDLNK